MQNWRKEPTGKSEEVFSDLVARKRGGSEKRAPPEDDVAKILGKKPFITSIMVAPAQMPSHPFTSVAWSPGKDYGEWV